ncbi:right-handed parallel beta-helix repeat-containing protein [Streptomyces sp. NPDC050145]|uniref:right-handed parallel beta-helix repeat-containing protein n=1 Tax=Streptomyces sp. NPDC050145 TaxID=3365602 RepID=UPI00378F589B
MRRITTAVLAAAGCVAAVLGTAPAAGAAPHDDPRVHHVDCQAPDGLPETGTAKTPWRSLAAVNGQRLRPGDSVVLKRGTRCVGTLAPAGAGRAGAPVRIGAYGDPAAAKPVVDGNGAVDAVLLRNTQWIELSDLDITNAANPGTKRRGVRVLLDDYGTGTHYRISNLTIHDVLGDDTKDANGSEGILFAATGTRVPSRFDDVRVENNRLDHIDRGGIRVSSTWSQRPGISDYKPGGPAWTPSTRVVVRGNTLSDLGGDGIVMTVTDGALVEHNTLRGFQRRSAGYNAGMWPYNADGTVFQYNDTSGGETTRDGMAYDVDEGTNGTVFQYNYSHDNAGGFFLVCTADGSLSDAVIRFNVSQNDHFRGIETCRGTFSDVRFLHNTIYVGDGVSQTVVNENTTNRHEIAFVDNVVQKAGAGTANLNLRSGGVTLSHNALYGVGSVPDNPGGVSADPRLTAPGTATGLADAATAYTPSAGSPVIGAGAPHPDAGPRDYAGNPVAAQGPVSIGALNAG